MLAVTKKSPWSGKELTLELDITQEQLDKYERGEGLVQVLFPHLSADEREFLITGTHPGEWDEHVSDED